ncbi:MAG: hypothetical protein H0X36_03770 [Sphingomonadaceae bacterium]|nr:hypothetical protein [Sphingomonadaceae bacterium]
MLALLLIPSAAAATAPASGSHPASLVGDYDGHQMEMGAELRLDADGRFQYGLAYGALDEEAEGTWVAAGDRVILTSDPVKAPRFVLVTQRRGPAGTLRIALDAPKQMLLQYFDAIVERASGRSDGEQFADDGLSLPVDPHDPPVRVRLVMQLYDLRSDPVPVDAAKGYALSFRFEPNDLGKVDFRGTSLRIENGELLIERLGRNIRFHRNAAP